MGYLQKAILRMFSGAPAILSIASLCLTVRMCVHTHTCGQLGLQLEKSVGKGPLILLPPPRRGRWWESNFICRSTPQRQLRWAMKRKQCGSPAEQRETLWYTARQNWFLKIKERESRPFSPPGCCWLSKTLGLARVLIPGVWCTFDSQTAACLHQMASS